MRKPNTEHADYKARKAQWKKLRDCIEGEEAMKSVGAGYIPKLGSHGTMPAPAASSIGTGVSSATVAIEDPQAYSSYVERATVLNAVAGTVGALVGLLFDTAPKLEWPEADQATLKRAGPSGESFKEIAACTADEVVGVGRFGALIDGPQDGSTWWIASYSAESIADWETNVVNGQRQPTRIVLCEETLVLNADGDMEARPRRRVLRLVTTMAEYTADYGALEKFPVVGDGDFPKGRGLYICEVWDAPDSKSSEFTLTSLHVPRMAGGRAFDEIPFTFYNPKSIRVSVEKPPLIDLANCQIGHFRNSADIEHGAHYTSIPTPTFTGWSFKNGGVIGIGPGAALVTDNDKANSKYLEFTGAGMGFLKDLMAEKRSQMAALGARMLEEPTGSAHSEAGVTREQRTQGDKSALARAAIAISQGLTRTLRLFAEARLGISREEAEKRVAVELHRDFRARAFTPEMLREVRTSYNEGAISWRTFFLFAQGGGVIPDDVTEDQERDLIVDRNPRGDEDEGPMGKPSKGSGADDGKDERDDGKAEKGGDGKGADEGT